MKIRKSVQVVNFSTTTETNTPETDRTAYFLVFFSGGRISLVYRKICSWSVQFHAVALLTTLKYKKKKQKTQAEKMKKLQNKNKNKKTRLINIRMLRLTYTNAHTIPEKLKLNVCNTITIIRSAYETSIALISLGTVRLLIFQAWCCGCVCVVDMRVFLSSTHILFTSVWG